jgi:hypothetical protein
LKQIEPWIVLAVGVLITSCCTRNFAVIELLKAPIRHAGPLNGSVGAVDLPSWFPLQDAVLEAAGGVIQGKLGELPISAHKQEAGPQTVRLQIDLGQVSLPAISTGLSLTYFPWFRFLSEPLNFDAIGRVAEYVAGSFRFLLERNGTVASVEGDGDSRRVRTAAGLEIEVTGMAALRSVTLASGPMRTSIDLNTRRIEIDHRMFPAAYEAGAELLKTPDRLINVDATIDESHLYLAAAGGGANV